MKLKNISIGDFIEAKNKHGGDVGLDVLEVGKSYEVLGFNKNSDLTVIISVPNHNTFYDGFYVRHECFRKPRPQPKQLDQSVFNGLDEKWRFAAVDQNAETNLFEEKPIISSCRNYWVNASGAFKRSVLHFDNSNWQNSLIERDTSKELLEVDLSSELTGSDYFYSNITSSLLENGSKLVVCFVSNLSESDALDEKHIEVITSLDTSFNDSDGYGWQYVVPINNQGEPLTAAEVGL